MTTTTTTTTPGIKSTAAIQLTKGKVLSLQCYCNANTVNAVGCLACMHNWNNCSLATSKRNAENIQQKLQTNLSCSVSFLLSLTRSMHFCYHIFLRYSFHLFINDFYFSSPLTIYRGMMMLEQWAGNERATSSSLEYIYSIVELHFVLLVLLNGLQMHDWWKQID